MGGPKTCHKPMNSKMTLRRPKIAPKMVQDSPQIIQHGSRMVPGSPQHGQGIPPERRRDAQDRPKRTPERTSTRPCGLRWPIMIPTKPKKEQQQEEQHQFQSMLRECCNLHGFKHERDGPECHKMGQDSPKMAQDRPTTVQDSPKVARGGPRWPQDGSS